MALLSVLAEEFYDRQHGQVASCAEWIRQLKEVKERERRVKLATIQALLNLMDDSGKWPGTQRPGTISPYGNGYGLWFLDYDVSERGTAPLSAEELLERIEDFDRRIVL